MNNFLSRGQSYWPSDGCIGPRLRLGPIQQSLGHYITTVLGPVTGPILKHPFIILYNNNNNNNNNSNNDNDTTTTTTTTTTNNNNSKNNNNNNNNNNYAGDIGMIACTR